MTGSGQAYGLTQRASIVGSDARFKFTGKEFDSEDDFDMYYFGARYYDPVVARWNGADPLDFKYPSWSSYNYTLDNPIAFIDPDGRGVVGKSLKIAARVNRNKLFNAARRKAVREAWKQEKQLLIDVGKTTMDLAVKEKSELLETGKVRGWFGHHSNNVQHHSLEMAANPDNIKFVKGVKAHLSEHGGNFKNKTSGPLIERISKMSGPAMLTFFLTYERVLNNMLSQGSIYSAQDSWLSLINPFNSVVEIVALTEALAAANATEGKTKKGDGGADIVNPSVINGPGDSELIQLESGGL